MEYASVCMEIFWSKWYTSRNFVSIQQCCSFFLLMIPPVNWLFGLAKWKANLPIKFTFLSFPVLWFQREFSPFFISYVLAYGSTSWEMESQQLNKKQNALDIWLPWRSHPVSSFSNKRKLKLCLEQLLLHEDPWQKIWNNTGAQIGIRLLTSYKFITDNFIIVLKSVKKYCRLFSCKKVALGIEKQIAITL